MSLRSYFDAKWPEAVGVASLALIGFVVWTRYISPRRAHHRVVHLSCFAYRDINRNGIYDIEDRPYAGLKVTIERPKGGPVVREANVAGFANFDMSGGNRKADVYLAGEYTVRIEPPAGWEVTSSNALQRISIQKNDRAAVGLITVPTITSVGVAPQLKISGSVDSSLTAAGAALKVKDPAEREFPLNVSKDGAFSFPASKGTWRIDCAASKGAKLISRSVEVMSYPVVVSRIAAPAQSYPQKPNTRKVGFDNLTPSDTLYEIPNGYEGLNWRNWVATHQKLYEGNGFVNVATSSEYVAYSSAGHPATISSPKAFDFVGAYVGTAWPGGEHDDVVVKAWRNESPAYEDRFRVTTAGPIYFDADYRNVTRLEFSSDGYWQLVVDDMVFRTE